MAITARAEGTWAEYTADGTVAVPAAQVTGDLMLLLASWKDYIHTATVNGGWAEITEFADGTTSKGNGTGSMKVGAWYKVATSDTEADPTLDWTTLGANDIAGAVIIVFQKAASEEWAVPAFATAAMTTWTTTSQTVTAGSDPGITAGDVLIGLIGIRDNTAAMTRGATTGLAATGITWAANYVEYPATHFDTTTGFDMAADAGYRIASSGTSSAAPTMEGTLSAAETGAALWLRLRVSVATTANAEVATTTGAANSATTLLTANVGVATISGQAYDATVQTGVTANAGLAEITAAALNPTTLATINADVAAVTAAALTATALETVNAGLATAAVLGNDATADTVDGGHAWGAWSQTWVNEVDLVTVNAGVATATAEAYSPTALETISAGVAEGTGAALTPNAAIVLGAGLATATGLAYDATVTTQAATTANAGIALGLAAAYDPSGAIGVYAAVATGVGQAYDATITTSTGTAVNAGLAEGTGLALNPTAQIAVSTILATGSGQAYDATITTGAVGGHAGRRHGGRPGQRRPAEPLGPIVFVIPDVVASAGVAEGVGQAYDASITWNDDETALLLLLNAIL